MKKKIFIFLSIFILSLIFVSGAYFLWRHVVKSPNLNLLGEKKDSPPKTELIPSFSELNSENEKFKAAVSEASSSKCQELALGNFQNYCLTEVALKEKNDSACSLISEKEARDVCLDKLKYQLALENNDLQACPLIASENASIACVKNLAKKATEKNCLELNSKLSDVCLTIVFYDSAKKNNSLDLCRKIPDLMTKSNCLSEIGGVDNLSDVDKDGLKFFEEIINGTDPSNKDSDGDGFLDSEEVKSGNNPTGVGSALYNYLDCNEIEYAPLREICLAESMGGKIMYNDCSIIKNGYLRDYCYNKIRKK